MTKNDFRTFLCHNGVFNPTQVDIDGLMAKFDYSMRGRITYSEFCDELNLKLPRALRDENIQVGGDTID